jgi:hypothetical protein
MRLPLAVIFRLFFLSITALLAFGCQWDGDIYLDVDGIDSETTPDEAIPTDTATGTGNDIETEELDSDTGSTETDSETDFAWSNTLMELQPVYMNYRFHDPPDDRICVFLFPQSQFPDDGRFVRALKVDFSKAVYHECWDAIFDEYFEDLNGDYFFYLPLEEEKLKYVEEEEGVAGVVLYRYGDFFTPPSPTPGIDYWGYTYFFPEISAEYDPRSFYVYEVSYLAPPPG